MATDADARKELKAHERSYDRFIAMMKWGTILSVIAAFLVIMIISN